MLKIDKIEIMGNWWKSELSIKRAARYKNKSVNPIPLLAPSWIDYPKVDEYIHG